MWAVIRLSLDNAIHLFRLLPGLDWWNAAGMIVLSEESWNCQLLNHCAPGNPQSFGNGFIQLAWSTTHQRLNHQTPGINLDSNNQHLSWYALWVVASLKDLVTTANRWHKVSLNSFQLNEILNVSFFFKNVKCLFYCFLLAHFSWCDLNKDATVNPGIRNNALLFFFFYKI